MERSDNKLKILYTIPNFNTAGSGKVLYDLAKGLDKTKFEVHIACSHSKGAFFLEIEKLGLSVHIIETTCQVRPLVTILKRIRPYRQFIKQNKFDIVHSWHWSSDWTEVLGVKLGGAKFVYTKKAMTWGNIHWKIRSFLSDFIVTINDEMSDYFSYKSQQKLIPIGLDVEYYNSKFFQKEKNSTNKFKIITVANLVPVKNIEILINALHELKNQSIYLEILGDNKTEYGLKLEELVKKKNLVKQITFLGKQLDIRPYLANADLCVMPSKKEGLGVALIEAMAMGKPVLGSNASGINFILKDFPNMMFDSSNSTQLAQKINEIIGKSKEERNEIGQLLRKYCEENFSLQKFIAEHEELYCKIARNK